MKNLYLLLFTSATLLAGTASAQQQRKAGGHHQQPATPKNDKGPVTSREDCDADFFFIADEEDSLKFTFSAFQVLPGFEYYWDFGDGSADSTTTDPVHTYATPGIYTACLKAYKAAKNITCIECYEVYAGVTIEPDPEEETGRRAVAAPRTTSLPVYSPAVRLLANPVSGSQALLTVTPQHAGPARTLITDMAGRIQATGYHVLQQGMQTLRLDVGNLKPGTYLLRLEGGGLEFRTLLVKP